MGSRKMKLAACPDVANQKHRRTCQCLAGMGPCATVLSFHADKCSLVLLTLDQAASAKCWGHVYSDELQAKGSAHTVFPVVHVKNGSRSFAMLP